MYTIHGYEDLYSLIFLSIDSVYSKSKERYNLYSRERRKSFLLSLFQASEQRNRTNPYYKRILGTNSIAKFVHT